MRNWEGLVRDPRAIAQFLFGAAPATLFVLVPLFAVLLRIATSSPAGPTSSTW